MKKILVISGSPRKGDSYQVVSRIEKKMQGIGGAKFEYLTLLKLSIKNCRGCLSCMRKGEDQCPLKDDVPMIRDKLLNADGVIFVTPVYIHSVTASLKNLLDRLAYYLHRPCFHDKFALIVCTTELSGLKETIKYLSFPIKTMGFSLVGAVGVLMAIFYEPGPYRNEMIAKIDKTAECFYQRIKTQASFSPSLGEIILFEKLRASILVQKSKFVADYEYWRDMGWLSADYFYPIKINIIKKAISRLPLIIATRLIRLKIGTEVYRKVIGQHLEN